MKISEEQERKLKEFLVKIELIPPSWTGNLDIGLFEGGIRNIKKTEILK